MLRPAAHNAQQSIEDGQHHPNGNNNDRVTSPQRTAPTQIQNIRRTHGNNPTRLVWILTRASFVLLLYSWVFLFGIPRNIGDEGAVVTGGSSSSAADKRFSDPRGLESIKSINENVSARLKEEHETWEKEIRARVERQKQAREEAIETAQNALSEQKNNLRVARVDGTDESLVTGLDRGGSNITSTLPDAIPIARTVQEINDLEQDRHSKFTRLLTFCTILTLLRICTTLLVRYCVDEEAETLRHNSVEPGTARPFSFSSMGMTSPFHPRRRGTAAVRRRDRYNAFVDGLNRTRLSNGERPISVESLQMVLSNRDFNGNDYDDLWRFNEENGPAIGSLMSSIGATEAEIERCPMKIIENEEDEMLKRVVGKEGVEVYPQCPVCLERYQLGERVRTIPCFHTFHANCIDQWLTQKAECPICKFPAIG